MSEFEGPWSSPEPADAPAGPTPRAPRRWRRPGRGLILWLGLMALVGAGFGLLVWLRPGQLHGDDWTDAAYLFGLGAVVSRGLIFARDIPIVRTVRHIAIWAAIGLAIVAGYTFRGEGAALAGRMRAALDPAAAQAANPRTMVVGRGEDGQFYVTGEVSGAPVRFLVDTGASDIVLSRDDARRVGLDPSSMRFARTVETANGVGRGATIVVSRLSVGPIAMRDVRVSVNQAPMASSLLGMSFLRKLDSFEVKGDQLFLTARG
jgi:aspartyl protease family protein